ncbi:hypothetical protein [Sphingobacterium gobiense]|uniref:Uncharacterized protein n=1 Tax=Sphingobacterium gobiense TaxID=1382456 RepID=A0A2S9JUS2_9SPHI|nr:hypothetical protein [Sphingobacterium gobiense]PRD57019.1 hypothetical protein C5749_07365 [Sphingobacterium gobiense]
MIEKNILRSTVVLAILALTTQCRPLQNVANNNNKVQNDSTLYAVLAGEEKYTLHGVIPIKFSVTNPTDDTLKFTQYHTPFEGMMSKFLTITDSAGNDIQYIGAMTRRVMPPPAETYHAVAPGETKSVTFDLNQVYKIEKAGPYTLQYAGGNISGVASGEPIVITVEHGGEANISRTLIIMLSEETSLEAIAEEAASYGADVLYKYNALNGLAVKIPESKSVNEAMEHFKKLQGVVSVSKDQISTIQH